MQQDSHDHHKNMRHDSGGLGSNSKEYLKFGGVLLAISLLSLVIWRYSLLSYLDAFMGVFFVVFACFKITQLKVFAYGFQSYDLVAKKSLFYSYSYPFVQLIIGLLYLFRFGSLWLDVFVVIISSISGAGVLNSLYKKQALHCVCLGNVIKLPLSRISIVEDFGMAIMALTMIIVR